MSSIRVRFTRGDNVKFISHLDLMKLFERALRRSGVPIAYSQGFNPHPQMVFGLPLSVGVTSEAEYADFDMAAPITPAEFRDKLNEQLPGGIEILEAVEKTSKGNIMASISGAVYTVTVFLKDSTALEELDKKVAGFVDKAEIIVKKEGKGGIKNVNIRPMIHKLEVYPAKSVPAGYGEFKTAFVLEALLGAGSVANLKPELLLSAFSEYSGLETGAALIHRKELYVDYSGTMADPLKVV